MLKVAKKVRQDSTEDFSLQLKAIDAHEPACTPTGLRKLVGHAKLTECYFEAGSGEPPLVRIELGCNFKMEEVVEAIGDAILEVGGREVTGKPPKGKWERNIVASLKKLGSWVEEA